MFWEVLIICFMVAASALIALEIFFTMGKREKELKTKIKELSLVQLELQKDLDHLKMLNLEKEKALENDRNLYEMLKELTHTLDELEMFKVFKEKLKQYVPFEDCRFIEGKNIHEFRVEDYDLFPVNVEDSVRGYLAIKGYGKENMQIFHILANQFSLGLRRVKLYREIEEKAITDDLTKVFVRRYVMERFYEELLRSKKLGAYMAFLMVDIDDFKKINDSYGHLIGDAVLREVAARIKSTAREIDLIGKFGGEEFCLILADTDKEGALKAGNRICEVVSKSCVEAYDEKINVTVSVGGAVFPDDGVEPFSLIDKADEMLYKAKALGKNRAVISDAG